MSIKSEQSVTQLEKFKENNTFSVDPFYNCLLSTWFTLDFVLSNEDTKLNQNMVASFKIPKSSRGHTYSLNTMCKGGYLDSHRTVRTDSATCFGKGFTKGMTFMQVGNKKFLFFTLHSHNSASIVSWTNGCQQKPVSRGDLVWLLSLQGENRR
jgi:hypothetical protein